jgi:hypothetical protein
MTRHRWRNTDVYLNPGRKYFRCVQCNLLKVTEWDEKPYYTWSDGRTWHRFAPPCPPPPDLPPLTAVAADRLARAAKTQRPT